MFLKRERLSLLKRERLSPRLGWLSWLEHHPMQTSSQINAKKIILMYIRVKLLKKQK